jgi:hypothetical protein
MTRVFAWMLPTWLGIAAAIFYITPAWPQAQRVEAPEGQAAIGRIVIVNQTTVKVDAYRKHTVGGVEVTVHYNSMPNSDPDPRDIITISVPDGYMAIPSDVLLPEGESVEVLIYEAIVG